MECLRCSYGYGDEGSLATGPGAAQPRCTTTLTHVLVGIDAPDLRAPEPAADALHLDPAPLPVAFQQARDHARLGACHRGRTRVGAFVQEPNLAADNDGALLGDHALVHPTLGTLPVADLAPDVALGDHLHRETAAAILPLDPVLIAGSDAEVDAILAQAFEARQRRAAVGPCSMRPEERERQRSNAAEPRPADRYFGGILRRTAHGSLL